MLPEFTLLAFSFLCGTVGARAHHRTSFVPSACARYTCAIYTLPHSAVHAFWFRLRAGCNSLSRQKNWRGEARFWRPSGALGVSIRRIRDSLPMSRGERVVWRRMAGRRADCTQDSDCASNICACPFPSGSKGRCAPLGFMDKCAKDQDCGSPLRCMWRQCGGLSPIVVARGGERRRRGGGMSPVAGP